MNALEEIKLLNTLQKEIENLRRYRGTHLEEDQKTLVKILFKELFGEDIKVEL